MLSATQPPCDSLDATRPAGHSRFNFPSGLQMSLVSDMEFGEHAHYFPGEEDASTVSCSLLENFELC